MNTKASPLVRGTLFWLPVIAVVLILSLFGNVSKPIWSAIFPNINTLFAAVLTLIFFAITGKLLEFSFVRNAISKVSKTVLWRLPGAGILAQKRKLTKELTEYQGALFPISDGVWVIGAVTGVQKMEYEGDEEESVSIVPDRLYKGYCPSSPIPWSGLPVIFARKEKVIFLDLSIGEIWNITTSFGKSSPDVISYLMDHSTSHSWDEE